MKKLLSLMLVISITSHSYAQKVQSKEDKTFEFQEGIITKRFWIDLGNGDKLQLEASDLKTLAALKNIDSIVSVFLDDFHRLKDTFNNELQSKRIDYVFNKEGVNAIRIQKYMPRTGTYGFMKDEIVQLKFEQDTLHMIGSNGDQYWALTFYLNDFNELEKYLSNGLSAKIAPLLNNPWDWAKGKDGQFHLKADPAISSTLRKGNITQQRYMTITGGAGVQNYKYYFIPSFTESLILVDINTSVKREWGFSAEQLFSFSKDSSGSLKTFVDHILTVSFSQSNNINPSVKKARFPISFSIGYMISHNADIFKKNTFRLSMGKLSLYGGKTNIEPLIYFNDLFQGITPGIRLVQQIF